MPMYACSVCYKTFASKAKAVAHEVAKHAKYEKRMSPHKSLRKTCTHCGKRHSTSQHASHGKGSFDATHDLDDL